MKKLALLILLFLLTSSVSYSQILTFEFSSLAGDEVSAASNTNDANLSTSTISRGAGLTASANGGRFNASNWALTSINNAVAGNDYMEFTISPNSGFQFNISSIYIQLQRSATGPSGIALRSSLDGYSSNLDQEYPIVDNTNTQNFTFTFLQLNSSSPVTYRVYMWAEATAGSGGIGDGAGNDIIVYGTTSSTGGSTPTLIVNPLTLNSFTYLVGSGPSAEQTFTVSGNNLTNDISIVPPANYEFSTGTGGSFLATNPITLTQSGGSVASTTIYVRLVAGLSAGTYSGQTITATSTGATSITVTCNGTVTLPLPDAFINEIHYDNTDADLNEFVEIVIPVAYTTPVELAKFSVVLYNGAGGASYDTRLLTAFTEGDTETGYTYYYFVYPINGIQNGAPDGLALGYDGVLLQFLSYEGTLTATNGIANGVLSTDVGVSENGSETGMSIGLRTDLPVWALLIAQTPGSINALVFPVELTSFSATTIGSTVKLSWNTATEVNNYGFEVERMSNIKGQTSDGWANIGFVNGNGNSNSPKSYSYEDKNVTAGKYSYRLKQIDNDGQFEYSKAIEVDFNAAKKFELSQNYPNPFNPATTIRFNLPEAGNVKITLYNLLGQEIRTLVNGYKESGVHTINFDASDLNSGMYIYKIEAGSFVQTRKMTLIK